MEVLSLMLNGEIQGCNRKESLYSYKLIAKGLLPFKLKLYLLAHLWESYLPGNQH